MRNVLFSLIVIASMLLAAPAVTAQEASPEASGESMLAGLGYPDLEVAVDSESVTLPAELEANRYRLVVDNASPQYISDLLLLQIPEGMAVDDAVALAEEAAVSDMPSDEFYNLTFVGGTTTFPESVNDAIITVAPGSYVVMNVQWDVEDPEAVGPSPVVSFEATGELPELTDPEADVVVDILEMTIDMPDTIAAGPQIWQVSNSGAFEHLVEINSVPVPVTPEQVQATLNAFFEIPPTPGAEEAEIIEEEIVAIDLLTVISPGQTTWYEVDLEPGNYIAFCWVAGPGDVPPHALMGMFAVFTVE
jgi:hypothetical protein